MTTSLLTSGCSVGFGSYPDVSLGLYDVDYAIFGYRSRK